jgi:hypothetical protein
MRRAKNADAPLLQTTQTPLGVARYKAAEVSKFLRFARAHH